MFIVLASKRMKIAEHHVLQALEGYLKSMSMIDDDAIVVSVKRNRDNTYEVELKDDE